MILSPNIGLSYHLEVQGILQHQSCLRRFSEEHYQRDMIKDVGIVCIKVSAKCGGIEEYSSVCAGRGGGGRVETNLIQF